MLFVRVSYLEILIVLTVVLLTFSPYFLKRDVERIRAKFQILERANVSHGVVTTFLLTAYVLILLLHFWVF